MCVFNSNVNLLHSNECVVLFPEDPDVPPIDYRELHTIVRELTYGIFVLHQTPLISLEANYDQSTSCQLPPAYQDTRIGQILVNVDYMMKCLWHGAYIPKDKRTKFSERWRSNLDINQNGKPETKKPLLMEFTSAGKCFLSPTKTLTSHNLCVSIMLDVAGLGLFCQCVSWIHHSTS